MSDTQASIRIGHDQPGYTAWRGKLLAELALTRVPSLLVHKRPDQAPANVPYDFLAAVEHGVCFYVEVNAFASFRLNRGDVRTARELHWSVDADLVRHARAGECPYFLFLFDADAEHGRYLRLDTLPEPSPRTESLPIRFPLENTITKESLLGLIEDLKKNLRPREAAPA